MLKLAYVAGVTPAKWLRIWNQRNPRNPLDAVRTEQDDQLTALRDGTADAALVRLPIDEEGLSIIRLYSETAVVVAPKDHAIEAADELTLADIESEPRLADAAAFDGAMQMELVASGSGIIVVPHSIARLYSRKDVVARPVVDAPETQIALVWPKDATTPDVEEFIGIVRGRTANSSRGAETEPAPKPVKKGPATTPPKKKTTIQPRRTRAPRSKRRRG